MSQGNLRSFLQNLDRSKLLGAEGAAELWQKACDESDALASAEAFASWMVKQGNLTRHQADKLLKGHTRFFLDDYKLLDLIGAGRMAGVYKAVHKLGMPVAVKILPPKSAKQPELLARFQREAELALQLDHPHVVKTYHAGVSDGLHYIAMEFLEGETLEERLKEKRKLPPAEAMQLALQALQGLGHLLDKGMVHRDIKPGNLMLVSLPGGATVENLYAVKLLDVGLGRALFAEDGDGGTGEELTAAGAQIGTPDYSAPEQSRDSHAADIRSDLYSLGCVLYECLAGHVPFTDKNLLMKLLKHEKEMPPPLELGGYPQAPQLQAWLWKLLAKKPAERFQTPAEAATALQTLFAVKEAPLSLDEAPMGVMGRIGPISPIGPIEEIPSPTDAAPKRSRLKFVVIGSGALCLLGVASYFAIPALTGSSKQKPSQGQDKIVASAPTPNEEIPPGPPTEPPKGDDGPAKKTEPKPKITPKKTEPKPKVIAKKTEAEPKVPVKKVEPEPKVVAKKPEPDPVPPAKKEEPKKDPVVVAEPPAPADERLPVPPADQTAKAEAQIKKVFGGDYAKVKTAERLALASKLLEESFGSKDDVVRYVMLRDARNIAASAGNAVMAMNAAQEMANGYRVSAGKARAAVADRIPLAGMTPAAASESTEALFAAVEAARVADDWPSAVALARAADEVARKSQSAVLTTLAQTKLTEVETMKAEADRVKKHLATLKTNPDDPAANLAVGRFRCLIKQDWDAGIELLAKGPDGKLKATAAIDIKAGTGNDEDRMEAGEGWYDLARAGDSAGKFAMQMRAHFWYGAALTGLSGLEKVKAEKRLAELQAVLEARGGKMKLWMANRQAVVDGQIKKWNLIGSNPVMRDFEEIPKDGAILIGFNYTVWRNGVDPPDFLQPIFLSPRGEIKGKAYGVAKFGQVVQVTKAKPGYAVGALYVRANRATRLWIVKPIYMKMTDKGLDPNERYIGQHIGGDDRYWSFGTVGGDGNFIVGIRGKTAIDTNAVGTISIVTLTTQESASSLLDPKRK